MTIPKKIFYVWSVHDDRFYDVRSKNNSLKAGRICYFSWERHLPGYEIIEANENVFDYQGHCRKNRFFRLALENRLWAFVADYVRVHMLYEHGGIYVDTDVQVLKNFDAFLDHDFFISLQHWKQGGNYTVEPAIMGCTKGHPLLKRVIDFYENDFWNSQELIMPEIFGRALRELYGFKGSAAEVLGEGYAGKTGQYFSLFPDEYFAQRILRLQGLTIYPEQYFCPKWMTTDDRTEAPGAKGITENTVSIHWNNSSWLDGASLKKMNKLFKRKNKYK